MSLDIRDFGMTGLKVTALGFGAGMTGTDSLTDKEAKYLLNSVLDNGINLIDTARSYGLSEERIGKHLSKRRSEFVLSTKVGYDVEGYEDWTYDCIIAGVDKALKILKTDYIDIVHLHSCNLDKLQEGAVTEALIRTVQEGKVRVPAYSGDNDALNYAVYSGRFGGMQASINITDQKAINDILYPAKKNYMGVIAKRPSANSVWKYNEAPVGDYIEQYFYRLKQMDTDFGMPVHEAALRFAAYTYGVDSVIVGTTNIEHLKQNIAIVGKGKLPDDLYQQIRNKFNEHGSDWYSLV
ncbi:MAG: aldo/keto reductase [Ignavibacteriaceae bacterium]|nr:aldo/keto reductase [Ignavibacteriaceae bacterium]NUM69711.1 aldo/keto reductase [Ignavibacteriaceae bacterium]